jgi:hypothetical protein
MNMKSNPLMNESSSSEKSHINLIERKPITPVLRIPRLNGKMNSTMLEGMNYIKPGVIGGMCKLKKRTMLNLSNNSHSNNNTTNQSSIMSLEDKKDKMNSVLQIEKQSNFMKIPNAEKSFGYKDKHQGKIGLRVPKKEFCLSNKENYVKKMTSTYLPKKNITYKERVPLKSLVISENTPTNGYSIQSSLIPKDVNTETDLQDK